jgi:hypothetical protein
MEGELHWLRFFNLRVCPKFVSQKDPRVAGFVPSFLRAHHREGRSLFRKMRRPFATRVPDWVCFAKPWRARLDGFVSQKRVLGGKHSYSLAVEFVWSYCWN